MEDEDPREDFLDRMVSLCRLLGIEAPPDQVGDVVAYQLDLDDVRFLLTHSAVDQPNSFLATCALGQLPATDRDAFLTHLLQMNVTLGHRGLGALGLDAEGHEASCLSRIDLARPDQAVLSTLLDLRDVAKDWRQRAWPTATEQIAQELLRP